jgi:hypothetical protein
MGMAQTWGVKGNPNRQKYSSSNLGSRGWSSTRQKTYDSTWYRETIDSEGNKTLFHLDETGRFIEGVLRIVYDNDAKTLNEVTTFIVDGTRGYHPRHLVEMQKESCRKRGEEGYYYGLFQKKLGTKKKPMRTGKWQVNGVKSFKPFNARKSK